MTLTLTLTSTLTLTRKANCALWKNAKPDEFVQVVQQAWDDHLQSKPFYKKHIAVGDDTPTSVMALCMHLKKRGAAVTRFDDGQHFVDRCADQSPNDFDAVVLDYTMPRLNGLQTLQFLANAHEVLPPVVVYSTEATQIDLKQSLLSAGAAACVEKRPACGEVLGELQKAMGPR